MTSFVDAPDVRYEGGICIVTTLKMPSGRTKPVESFINYHLKIGFDHIFLFFDDPHDSSIELAKKFSSVTIVVRGDEQMQYQKDNCSLWEKMEPYYQNEVPARQTLNAQHAFNLAKSFGLTWLLHIDIDELFYTKENSIKEHFKNLEDNEIYQMTYMNHEGIPEEDDTEDYFQSITLFRKHHLDLPMNSDVRKAMQFWEDRTTNNQYMLVYDTGKSCVRIIDGAFPKSVHKWQLPQGYENRSKTALADPRSLDFQNYLACDDPCILHYVCCGYSWFCDKYLILGKFADSWEGLPIAPSFHLNARDAVLNNDEDIALAFYNKQVLFRNEQELEAQLDSGTCVRIIEPSSILQSINPTIETLQSKETIKVIRTEKNKGISNEMDPLALISLLSQSNNIVNEGNLKKNKSSSDSNTEKQKNTEVAKPVAEKDEKKNTDYTYEKAWILSNIAKDYL